jgi:peptidoglycan/LPS O-acetylase OafA/YrhL
VIGDIEVLRAIAVLFSVVNHLDLLFPWTAGRHPAWERYATLWGGVDLFFCISGFVIARSFLHQRGSLLVADKSWRGFLAAAGPFWIRRAWRILPSAWLWLAVAVLCSAFFNHSGVWGSLAGNAADALSAVVYLANLHWLNCFHDAATVCNRVSYGLSHYWSLSLEEQFYILFPIGIFLATQRTLLPAILLGILAQFFLPRFSWDPLWAFRTDALLIGIALALWQGQDSHRRAEPSFLGRPWLRLPAVLLALAVLAFLPSPSDPLRFSTGLLALQCGLLVWLASYDRGYILGQGWISKIFSWLGARSYALYLIHLPAFLATRALWSALAPAGTAFGGSYTLRFALTAFALTALCVEVNFRLVERPLRRQGRRMAEAFAARLARGARGGA